MQTKAEITNRPSEVVLFLGKIPPHFSVGICLTRFVLTVNAWSPGPPVFTAFDIPRYGRRREPSHLSRLTVNDCQTNIYRKYG